MLTEGTLWLHLLACYPPLAHTEAKKESPLQSMPAHESLLYDISLMLMTYLVSYVLYLIHSYALLSRAWSRDVG